MSDYYVLRQKVGAKEYVGDQNLVENLFGQITKAHLTFVPAVNKAIIFADEPTAENHAQRLKRFGWELEVVGVKVLEA